MKRNAKHKRLWSPTTVTNFFSFYCSLLRSWPGRRNHHDRVSPNSHARNVIMLQTYYLWLKDTVWIAQYKKKGKMRAHGFLPRGLIGCEIYSHPGRIFRAILFTQPLIWKLITRLICQWTTMQLRGWLSLIGCVRNTYRALRVIGRALQITAGPCRWRRVLWGFLWVNVKLNCSLYPFVCFLYIYRSVDYIARWVAGWLRDEKDRGVEEAGVESTQTRKQRRRTATCAYTTLLVVYHR